MEDVVVAGAGFGGVSSAISLASRGYEVTLLDKNDYLTYTPGLIDLINHRVKEDKLVLDLESFFQDTGIDFRVEEIEELDPGENRLETVENTYNYGNLVLALGGDVMDFGNDISGLEKCYTKEQAVSLAERSEEVEEAVIVGAGYTGVEIAGELARKGIDVDLIDQVTRPMSGASEAVSEKVLKTLNSRGIAFKGDRKVVDVEGGKLELESGEVLNPGMSVWSTGIKSSEVVCESFGCSRMGVKVNPGLSCEDYENVFAVGDCADHGFRKTAHNAMRMGETVAENIGREEGEPLVEYDPGFNPLVVSIGKTGIMTYKGKAYRNRFFRNVKDFVRKFYWVDLKKQRLKLKYL